MGLDEAVLEDQCLDLVRGHDIIDIGNKGDETPGFPVMVTFLEVTGDPFFEVLRLSHVEEFAILSSEEITARNSRKRGRDIHTRPSILWRNSPVWLAGFSAISSGVPVATI
ncbi:MAG: hypothetical protein A4E42_02291 [Methanoregulaceae archaeon PtaU1.Bin222]|nr:MAG: hypothetical protein A4E42_02291 [Methanoregulaceae archaeon PtaU1.Bin222]